MSNQSRAAADISPGEPCRNNCPGYGTYSFCPPLIVLPIHSERAESELRLDRARYPLSPEMAQDIGRLGHFSGNLAAGEFCNCIFSRLPCLSTAKSQM